MSVQPFHASSSSPPPSSPSLSPSPPPLPPPSFSSRSPSHTRSPSPHFSHASSSSSPPLPLPSPSASTPLPLPLPTQSLPLLMHMSHPSHPSHLHPNHHSHPHLHPHPVYFRLPAPSSASTTSSSSLLPFVYLSNSPPSHYYSPSHSLTAAVPLPSPPHDWRSYNETGLVMHRNALLEQAIEHLTLAVQYGPADGPQRKNLAMVKVDLGTRWKLAGAIEVAVGCYLESIQICPSYAPAYFNLAVVHSERGQFEQALQFYHLALQHNPGYVEALCIQANTRVWVRQRKESQCQRSEKCFNGANSEDTEEFIQLEAERVTRWDWLMNESGCAVPLDQEPVPIPFQELYRVEHCVWSFHPLHTHKNESKSFASDSPLTLSSHFRSKEKVLHAYNVSARHLLTIIWLAPTYRIVHNSCQQHSTLFYVEWIDKFKRRQFDLAWLPNETESMIETRLIERLRHIICSSASVCCQHQWLDVCVAHLCDQLQYEPALRHCVAGLHIPHHSIDWSRETTVPAALAQQKYFNQKSKHQYCLSSLNVRKLNKTGTVVAFSIASFSRRFMLAPAFHHLKYSVVTHNCNIGVIYKNSGQLATSIEFYERALKINPNFAVASSNLAIAATDQGTAVKNEGRIDEGIVLYKKALHQNSKYSPAWYNLGVAYAEKLRFDDAKVCYEMCVYFDPKCAEAINNLGVIYKDRGNLEQAVLHYHEALKANPNFAQTLNNLSVIYTMLGKLDEAYEFCLASGTHVSLACGLNRAIEHIAEDGQHCDVLTFDSNSEKHNITLGTATLLLKQGVKHCVDIELSDGRRLTCTPDHLLLTVDAQDRVQWRRADSLSTQTRLAVGATLPKELDVLAGDKHESMSVQLREAMLIGRVLGYFFICQMNPKTAKQRVNELDVRVLMSERKLFYALQARGNHLLNFIPFRLDQLFKLFDTDQSNEEMFACSSFDEWLLSPSTPWHIKREFVSAALSLLVVDQPLPLSPAESSLLPSQALFGLWSDMQFDFVCTPLRDLVLFLFQCIGMKDGVHYHWDINSLSVSPIGFAPFARRIGLRYNTLVTLQLSIALAHMETVHAEQAVSDSSSCTISTNSFQFIQHCGATSLFLSSPCDASILSCSATKAVTIPSFSMYAASSHIKSYISQTPIFHLSIRHIRTAGLLSTFDITVPRTYCFFAEGVVAHNCTRAIKSNPLYAEALNNLGVLYRDEGRIEEAIASYTECLKIDPLSKNAAQNRLLALNSLTRVESLLNTTQMVTFNKEKLALQETLTQAHYALFSASASALLSPGLSMHTNSHANSNSNSTSRVLPLLQAGTSLVVQSEAQADHREQLLLDAIYEAHKHWGLQFAATFERERCRDWPECKPIKDRILRIGYISADFFTHSVSYFVEAPIVHRNRNHFHVTCYANVSRRDKKTQFFESVADAWRNILDLGAREVSELIQRDRIDILIECTGHTSGNRLDVCALTPAPIQMTWIGYPNTTGLQQIDYRLTDDIADPPETTQKYTEKLIRFKGPFLCYTPPLDAPSVSDTPALKNGFITFGSFNSLAKMNDTLLAVWCAILQAVPYSRMLIKCKPFASSTVQAKLHAKFLSYGIASGRVELIGLLPSTAEHLESYSMVDISVDTFPYSGTTTTCESLHSGVPVVTYARPIPSSHAHTVGASLIHRLGPEYVERLVAHSKEEYIAKSVQLASDIPRLQKMRAGLRSAFLSSQVCDGPALTRELERSLRQVWEEWCVKHSASS